MLNKPDRNHKLKMTKAEHGANQKDTRTPAMQEYDRVIKEGRAQREEALDNMRKRNETDGNFYRFNVNFSPSAYQVLQELADESGTSMSEMLSEAIALKKW